MNRILFAALTLLVSTGALASTDHFIRRDGNHVQHLKISKVGDDINVSMDVDFEPTGATEAGQKACSADISGDAKETGNNEITLRKQIEGEAKHCTLKINTSPEGAKVDQSEECSYYATGLCHFGSDGKELAKIK
jgi:hypothetical protein